MSFDLYFKSIGANSPGRQNFNEYFGTRKWYSVENDQAFYANEDTQTDFSFSWSDNLGDLIDDDTYSSEIQRELLAVEFSINLLRPFVFGLEAATELESFVGQFELQVFNPQSESRGIEAFNRKRLEETYDRCNQSALKATKREMPELLENKYHMPRQKMVDIWRWNYSREKRMESTDHLYFVPVIFFVEYGEGLKIASLWSDGIGTIFPEVDLIQCHKYKLAPRRWLLRQDQFCTVSFERFRDLITAYPLSNEPHKHWSLEYYRAPKEIKDRFRAIQQELPDYRMIPLEWILDEESLGII
jgi:hypothetical protein